jgi:transposase
MTQPSTVNIAQYVGLDLGDASTSYCVLDPHGQIVRQGAIASTKPELTLLFRDAPPTRVVMESSFETHWMSKTIRELGHSVVVANPRRLDLITKSVRKTDHNDAHMLARIARLDADLLQPVYERTDASLEVQTLIRARHNLVRARTRLISQVRCSVKVFGSRVPSCSPDTFHRRARLAIPSGLRTALLPLLDVIEVLKEKIDHFDKEIAAISKQIPQTQIFRDIHGVGPVLSLTYVVTIEDPRRFRSSRAVGTYTGLTPASRQSGSCNPRLGITKQGDDMLRSLLVTAATHILRRSAPDSDLKRYGRAIAAGGTPRDKGRARIAVARKLAVLMHRLWITGEVYQPLYSSTKSPKDS